jgi:hypothetical protein
MYKYLLVVLIFLVACKKDEPMQNKQIKGVVVSNVTKMPIPGQKVELTITTQKIVKTNDPEWPNGKPVYNSNKYETISDQSGQYQLPYLPWSYNVNVSTATYIATHMLIHVFRFDESIPDLYPDTIFVERPGFIQYIIKTSGALADESLFVNTPYHKTIIGSGPILRIDYQYNWQFSGKTDKIILDTIPAESISDPEVEWLRMKGTDTITHYKEKIYVQPGCTVNYLIQY